MTLFYRTFRRCACRRSKLFILLFVILFNFGVGLFLISSVISNAENRKRREMQISNVDDEMMDMEEIDRDNERKDQLNQSGDRYNFRIDYKIVQSVCKPVEIFQRSENVNSMKNLTFSKMKSLLSKNISIRFDLLSVNPMLMKTARIRQNGMHRSSKSLCDYILRLYVALTFISPCKKACRSREIEHLTSKNHQWVDSIELPYFFLFYFNSQSLTQMNIQQMFIYPATSYLDDLVYIRSSYQNRYVSTLILDANAYRSSITMSKSDRSLFSIKDGLDQNISERNSSTIFISFLSTTAEHIYLRHQSGRIKLSKFNQSNLFKQDATFKLLSTEKEKDLFAFQSINLPRYYIAVDPDTYAALVLEQPPHNSTNLEFFDKRFLFQFVYP